MQVGGIMVPRAKMDMIDVSETPDKFIPHVIATAHSRFPVIDKNRDDVIGVLLAKDLLRYYAGEEEFKVRDMLRPAVFVPESKRLNVLLREFRANRNHMAIVVDEYGGVAGLGAHRGGVRRDGGGDGGENQLHGSAAEPLGGPEGHHPAQ